jgi:molecular chaperone GrpE
MGDLLPVVDNLERALDHRDDASGSFADGVEMVLKQFRDVLARHGLEAIPTVGHPFDPHVHEAMMRAETDDVPQDHVVEEFLKGYRLGDYVVRPARVSVNTKTADEPAAGDDAEPEIEDEGVQAETDA